jgi:hypothetical protein
MLRAMSVRASLTNSNLPGVTPWKLQCNAIEVDAVIVAATTHPRMHNLARKDDMDSVPATALFMTENAASAPPSSSVPKNPNGGADEVAAAVFLALLSAPAPLRRLNRQAIAVRALALT